jgi:integrase/recombinase XerD
VKQRLAALRMLFDWMVVGQVLPVNPAHAARGPKYAQRRGKTPVLQADEARALLDAIATDSLLGLRDRALIGLTAYTFSRVGVAVFMKVEDYFVQGRRGWVRLHEKGGEEHAMPTRHNLDRYPDEYIQTDGIAKDRKGLLFRTLITSAVASGRSPRRSTLRASSAPERRGCSSSIAPSWRFRKSSAAPAGVRTP